LARQSVRKRKPGKPRKPAKRQMRVSSRRRAGSKLGIGLFSRLGSGAFKGIVLLVLMGGISVSFLFLYNYLVASPYLKLEELDVRGVTGTLQRELLQLGGLNSDMSLLGLRLKKLKRDMEGHPWIRSVELERQFPHTLVVRAERQTPSALVLIDGMYYMNRWGQIFKQVEPSEPMDLPIVTGVSEEHASEGKRLQRVVRVLRLLGEEQGFWSLKELSEVHLEKNGRMSLYFNHLAAQIQLKGPELENKMRGLKRVANHLIQTGRIRRVTAINLNRPDGAVVSFRKG